MRVQIPAYTDRWMMGDRYGDVVKVYWRKGRAKCGPEDAAYEVVKVKLDKSGKILPFMLCDCTVVS
jgi:hypothetical protein